MKAKELIEKLQKCDPEAHITIIQGETLECMPELWDDEAGEYGEVTGDTTNLFSVDLYSHEFYLLATEKEVHQ